MIVKFTKLKPNAVIPTYGTEGAAGCDLYAVIANEEKTKIHPGATRLIPTGLSIELPDGYFGAIYPRSGLASKEGLRLANCVGVIDKDYRGEILVALHNDSRQVRTITNGERIAQLIVQPYVQAEWLEVEELTETDRGEGGFGSTGTE